MPLSTVSFRMVLLALSVTSVGCASLRSRSADARPSPSTPSPRPNLPVKTPPPAPQEVREELDVVYAHAGGENQELDVYIPKEGAGPYPTVIFLHGGGWANGSHAIHRPMARTMATQGYVAVTVGYRLAPRHKFPAQIHDVKCAVRWLRANADRYAIDRERMGVVGFSAGAHLALLLGLSEAKDGLEGDSGHPEQSSSVQAIISIAGPTDLTRPVWPEVTQRIIADWIGGTREQMPDVYRTASPMTYVHRGAPPVMLIHGTEDMLVPYEQAKELHAALRHARVHSRLETLHGKGHGENWTPETFKHNDALVKEFLDKNLRSR